MLGALDMTQRVLLSLLLCTALVWSFFMLFWSHSCGVDVSKNMSINEFHFSDIESSKEINVIYHEECGKQDYLYVEHICKPPAIVKDPLLVVALPSYVKARENRDIVRQSWWKFNSSRTFKFFTIGDFNRTIDGAAIDQEMREHADLFILDGVDDGYYGLSTKVLRSIALAYKYVNGSYLLKTDDDSWVNIPRLLDVLIERPRRRQFIGSLKMNSKVQKTGKFREGKWPYYFGDEYQPYMLGGGYVLSWDLVKYIADSEHLLRRYTSEDVTVGAVLANLDIKRQDLSYLFKTDFTGHRWASCLEHLIVDHKMGRPKMRKMYENVISNNRQCSNETHDNV